MGANRHGYGKKLLSKERCLTWLAPLSQELMRGNGAFLLYALSFRVLHRKTTHIN